MICRQVGIFQVGNLVLKTADRKPGALTVAAQVRGVVAVVHVHVVRVVATELRRTPEVREVALVVVTPSADPVAGRQRREPESVRAVTAFAFIFVPAAGGLEDRTGSIPPISVIFILHSAHRREQCLEFSFAGQVPALGADSLDVPGRKVTFIFIAALLLRLAHRRGPGVQATVLGAVAVSAVVTVAIPRLIVQVLCHPHLVADGHRLVGFAVTGIGQGTVIAFALTIHVTGSRRCYRTAGLRHFTRRGGIVIANRRRR